MTKYTLKCETGHFKLKGGGTSARTESYYLIKSNKEKCKKLLKEDNWTDGNLINFFIGLHVVLEVSLNTFFRAFSLRTQKKELGQTKIIKNIDKTNFIDKTTTFIYFSNFKFGENKEKAIEYHSIIGKLRDFSNLRNLLLHGHSIGAIYEGGGKTETVLRKKINQKRKLYQIWSSRSLLKRDCD